MLRAVLKTVIREAVSLKKCLESPNSAIVDTIWISDSGTAVDALDRIISIGEAVLQEGINCTSGTSISGGDNDATERSQRQGT